MLKNTHWTDNQWTERALGNKACWATNLGRLNGFWTQRLGCDTEGGPSKESHFPWNVWQTSRGSFHFAPKACKAPACKTYHRQKELRSQHLTAGAPLLLTRPHHPRCLWPWRGNFKLPHRTGHPYIIMKIKCSENLNIKRMQTHTCMCTPRCIFLKIGMLFFTKQPVLVSFPYWSVCIYLISLNLFIYMYSPHLTRVHLPSLPRMDRPMAITAKLQ